MGNLHIPSIGGIKKQISKTDQLMSEKLTGADHTKLDDRFTQMEKVTDVFLEVEGEMYEKTRDILYPNPAVRVKQVSDKGIASIGFQNMDIFQSSVGIASKTLGGGGNQMLPLPEKALSESMEKGGRKMQELYGQEVSYFAESLILTGESMNQLGDMRTSMEDHVTQNFLCPIDDNKDLKNMAHHRKKVAGHKLDYDCKKRHGEQGTGMVESEKKFADSYKAAQLSMNSVIENESEYVMQISALSNSLNDYHMGCVSILEDLVKELKKKKDAADRRPRYDFKPRTLYQMTGQPPTNVNKNLQLDTNPNGNR